MADRTPFAAYEGRRMRGPDGNVYVVRDGRPVPSTNGELYSADDRATQTAALADAQKKRETYALAEQFGAVNRNAQTGGWAESELMNPKSWARNLFGGVMASPQQYQRLQQMDALTNRMVQANIIQGASSTMNSDVERQGVKATYPSVANTGETNLAIRQRMQAELRIAEARSRAIDAYLASHGSLNNFDAEWAPQEQAIRQRFGALGRSNQSPPRPPGVPAGAHFDAATRTWVE